MVEVVVVVVVASKAAAVVLVAAAATEAVTVVAVVNYHCICILSLQFDENKKPWKPATAQVSRLAAGERSASGQQLIND